MAISVSEPTAEINSGAGTAASFASFTPTANGLLSVYISAITASASTITIANTGTTLTWTKQKEQLWGSSDTHKAILWTAPIPSSTSASVITITGTSSWNSIVCAIQQATSQDPSAPIVQTVSGQADLTTSLGAIACSAVSGNNATVCGASGYAASGVGAWISEPSGYTKTADVTAGSGRSATHRGSMWYRTSGWTNAYSPSVGIATNHDLVMIFMEILAVGGSARSFCSGIIG